MKESKLIHRPYWYVKRLLDIILSIILIILTLPFMLLTLIILVINLGFPIFNQRRYREGMYKKKFLMYKFRTKKTPIKEDEIAVTTAISNISIPIVFHLLIYCLPKCYLC